MDNATFVRGLLSDFLSIKPYDYFASDHHEFLSAISKTNCKVVELSVGAELVATPIWQDIGNPAASIAIKNFIADFIAWVERVEVIREEYFQRDLDYRFERQSPRIVFGDECDKLEELRQDARFILELLAADKNPSKTKQAVDTKEIPVEYRTKPMTKKRAARLLGKTGDEGRAVEWLNKCIEDGTISWQLASRQSGFYDTREFPPSKLREIQP